MVENGIELLFIDPGKPMQNGYIEPFNNSFRDECPNMSCFVDLDDACRTIQARRVHYAACALQREASTLEHRLSLARRVRLATANALLYWRSAPPHICARSRVAVP
jgi:transposase InsO family protein